MKDFKWTPECQTAFKEIKRYLSTPPFLLKTLLREDLFVYLAAFPKAVGAVLIKEEYGVQKLICYMSHSLRETHRLNILVLGSLHMH